jgi:hypothetical protein
MATTTPNYGWTVPTSTDLVKDGATAIETLGDAIDASMNTALGTKKAGMVLLNTTSFSGVATQSINDVFSTTYDNYFITMNITSVSSTIMRFRWRVSGADNSTSNYNYQTLSANSTTLAGARALSTDINNIGVNNNNDHGINIVVLTPFATDKTYFSARNTGGVDSNLSDGKFNATTSFTGFTIIPGAGNISGTVQVFGYNK